MKITELAEANYQLLLDALNDAILANEGEPVARDWNKAHNLRQLREVVEMFTKDWSV